MAAATREIRQKWMTGLTGGGGGGGVLAGNPKTLLTVLKDVEPVKQCIRIQLLHSEPGASLLSQAYRVCFEQQKAESGFCLPIVRIDATGAGAELVHVGLPHEDRTA
ncbi:hypothetical protein MUK42_36009 [Musa troglodytarum]|uniref:Uncharacterized protein n=1 Tax=Musa troglodytarum TaxID=320322 RepID=A0A9E7F931_9LILI|nr:hypothetical protein MUK42_36009 [Musa troglodytarum]